MSAELLRRAAEKLAEHAAKAQAGPWLRAADHERATDYGFPANAVGFWDGEYARQVTYQATGDGAEADADARYIALMHPPVALALAELLDAHADAAEQWPTHNDTPDKALGALYLARAILREES